MAAKLIFSKTSSSKITHFSQFIIPQIKNPNTKTPYSYKLLKYIHTSFFTNNIINKNSKINSRRMSSLYPDLDLQHSRVPATIITGFLRAGKTTLLNHILTADHGKCIAVIENEFGMVGIEGSLVASHSSSNEDIIMVNNGCLCCTVRW